jgi:hypothetical protein
VDSFEYKLWKNIDKVQDIADWIFDRIIWDGPKAANFEHIFKNANVQEYLLESILNGASNDLLKYTQFLILELFNLTNNDLPDNAYIKWSLLVVSDKFWKTTIIRNRRNWWAQIYLSDLEHIEGNQYRWEGGITITI